MDAFETRTELRRARAKVRLTRDFGWSEAEAQLLTKVAQAVVSDLSVRRAQRPGVEEAYRDWDLVSRSLAQMPAQSLAQRMDQPVQHVWDALRSVVPELLGAAPARPRRAPRSNPNVVVSTERRSWVDLFAQVPEPVAELSNTEA